MEDWNNISKLIPGSTDESCMFKILGLKKIKLAQQKWSEYESKLLLTIGMYLKKEFRKSEKKNWRTISQELYKANENLDRIYRNAKQCKEHWVCYLNPSLKKGSWTLEEDKNLLELILVKKGCRKWSEIAKIFGGRTENALKNRYTLIIERLRREKKSSDDLFLIREYLKTLELKTDCETKKENEDEPKSADENRSTCSKEPKMVSLQDNSSIEKNYKMKFHHEENRESTTIENFQLTPTFFVDMSNSCNYFEKNCIPMYMNTGSCFWIFPNSI